MLCLKQKIFFISTKSWYFISLYHCNIFESKLNFLQETGSILNGTYYCLGGGLEKMNVLFLKKFQQWKYFTKQLIDLLDSCLSSTYKLSFITRNNYHFCKSIIIQISFSSHWYSSLLVKKVRAYMQFFRKRAKNVKKGQKSGKYLKIWAKMYTIWKYFEKGHVTGHDYHMQ